jgi:glycosyltransferase involved in cell wall biosynthesis
LRKLSVVIIAFNESHRIARCIRSVLDVADEILVVDSFSEDDTCEIAEALGAVVIREKFRGYVEQKNFAMSRATGDLILSLDADEAIDKILLKEIMKIKESESECVVFKMGRFNCYAGKWIYHGAWNPDQKIRLFGPESGRWAGVNLHEKFQPALGMQTISLKGKILHWSYDSVAAHESKIQNFARLGANSYFVAGKRAFWWNPLISPLFRFVRDYFFKAGFLDGSAGFTIAWLTAKEVRLKYQILRDLQKNSGIS